ncbi:PREDICTED: polygalacturonase At1g48100-like [Fragaria vesca subsp. vesca]
MRTFKLSSLAWIMLIAFSIWSSSLLETCEARKGKHHQWRKHRGTKRGNGGRCPHHHHPSGHSVSVLRSDNYITEEDTEVSAAQKSGAVYNVLDYGAKGDGKADDTKAFVAAWAAACKVQASTVTVPSGSVFLVKPISFSGPNCQPHIVFQLDGKIIAPTGAGAWGSGLLQWLEFTKLQRLTIRGKGVIDGQGAVWWNDSYNGKMPSTKPTALRFYGSNGVTVTGITIQNSPQAHLKFDSCTNVQVSAVTISSPGDSPNTDGIHLQNSQDVAISGASLACGNFQHSSIKSRGNLALHNVNCGPGHGVSIGGLGKDGTKACVSNITVRDVKLQNTLNGVRIKTWQGGSGSVKNVMFANIQVSEVEFPIMIDQFYCDKGHCANKTSAVAVSGINYVNIQGTYTSKPAHFACSDSIPCTGVSLDTIHLKSVQSGKRLYDPFCWEAYGELKTNTVPPIDCLMKGKPSSSSSSIQSEGGGYSC